MKVDFSSGNQKENIIIAHIAGMMYNLFLKSKGVDDLSIGFVQSMETRERELTEKETARAKHRIGVWIKDAFGFAEHQHKAIYGLVYKVTLQRKCFKSYKTSKMKLGSEISDSRKTFFIWYQLLSTTFYSNCFWPTKKCWSTF